MASTSSNQMSCKFCGKKFEARRSLEQHVFDSHRGMDYGLLTAAEFNQTNKNVGAKTTSLPPLSFSSSSSTYDSEFPPLFQQPFMEVNKDPIKNNSSSSNNNNNYNILRIKRSTLLQRWSSSNSSSSTSSCSSESDVRTQELYELYHGPTKNTAANNVNSSNPTLQALETDQVLVPSPATDPVRCSSSTSSSSTSSCSSESDVRTQDLYKLYHGRPKDTAASNVNSSNPTLQALESDLVLSSSSSSSSSSPATEPVINNDGLSCSSLGSASSQSSTIFSSTSSSSLGSQTAEINPSNLTNDAESRSRSTLYRFDTKRYRNTAVVSPTFVFTNNLPSEVNSPISRGSSNSCLENVSIDKYHENIENIFSDLQIISCGSSCSESSGSSCSESSYEEIESNENQSLEHLAQPIKETAVSNHSPIKENAQNLQDQNMISDNTEALNSSDDEYLCLFDGNDIQSISTNRQEKQQQGEITEELNSSDDSYCVAMIQATEPKKKLRQKVFPCPQCGDMMPSILSAANHCKAPKLQENRSMSNTSSNAVSTANQCSTTSKVSAAPKLKEHKCNRCGKDFNSANALCRHIKCCNIELLPSIPTRTQGDIRRHTIQSSLNNQIQNIRFENIAGPERNINLDEFFLQSENLIMEVIELLYADRHFAKVAFSLFCTYRKLNEDGDELFCDFYHHINAEYEHQINLNQVKEMLEAQIATFNHKGSGWSLHNVKFLDMNITVRYTISHHIGSGNMLELPEKLKPKKAVLNIQLSKAHKNQCFKYSILSAVHSEEVQQNKNRSSKYEQFESLYNWNKIKFPSTSEDFLRFQKQNKNIFINLFEYDTQKDATILICPAKIPDDTDISGGKIVNIMAVPFEDKSKGYHYVAIINLDRLLNNGDKNIRFKWCDHCIQPFSRWNNKQFDEHRKNCFSQKIVPFKMPKENTKVAFKDFQKSQKVPHVIYCDLECYLEKSPNSKDSIHKPYAFGVFLCTQRDAKFQGVNEEYKVFKGQNCIQEGLEHILTLSNKVYEWNKNFSRVPKKLSPLEKAQFDSEVECTICKKNFNEYKLVKCQDHDHITGKYRTALCSKCNLNCCLSRNKLPIFFHNLKNYDGHFLVTPLATLNEKYKWTEFDVLPVSSEKYITIQCKYTVDTYRNKHGIEKPISMTMEFKDSALFLNASLDKLVKQLEENDLFYSRKLLPSSCESNDLIIRKGVFPYEYFDSPARCQETNLPGIDCFNDELNKKTCTEEEYIHAVRAWNVFSCQSFDDYILKYLNLDVFQLADVFEKFRELGIKQDGLDPAHYLTIPGFSWDSALKMTGVNIDLLSDYEMHSFFQRGLRGGITVVNNHYTDINSPIHPVTYDPLDVRRELLYVDANNLYGRALSMALPLRDFRWLSMEEINQLNIRNLDLENGSIGYILEVDLLYPETVQNRSEDLPFAPESAIPTADCFTNHMNELYKELYQDKTYHGYRKLMLTHGNKTKYIVHGLLLQFYLEQGMILDKIHNVIEFRQERFFKSYIDFNSKKRQESTSEIERDYFKLKNNSLFGKTMENVLKRIKFKLVTNDLILRKYSTKPSFNRSICFNENLAGVYMQQSGVELNKPMFIGQAVLDISKYFMYKLRYEIFPVYEERLSARIRILGGDTDSFFLSVEGTSVYNDLLPMMKDEGLLDTSNYKKDHPLFSLDHKADLRCIKDEGAGKPFKEFILLKPKCYSMKYLCDSELKKAKGVRRVTLSKEMKFDDYFKTFKLIHKDPSLWQTRIASVKHNVKTLHYLKKVLSIWEDKRAWYELNHSLPYGNHRLQNKNLPKPVILPKTAVPSHNSVESDADESDADSFSDQDDFVIRRPPSKRRRVIED